MTKQNLASLLEWLRPGGIGLAMFLAYLLGHDAVSRFHILGPAVVLLMCGSVAVESLFLGDVAAAKIGYAPQRAYQIQSGLANAAIAVTALLVYGLGWGVHAEAAVVTAMLLFFALSAGNHLATAILERNLKPVNLLRPVMALLLTGILLPPMIGALAQ